MSLSGVTTLDRKADLFAPAPKQANSRPDFSGLWLDTLADREHLAGKLLDQKGATGPREVLSRFIGRTRSICQSAAAITMTLEVRRGRRCIRPRRQK